MSVKLLPLVLVLTLGLSYAQSDSDASLDNIHEYARALAAIGLLVAASYSGYKHMFTTSPMERKEAWETLTYAIVGASIVLVAPMLANALGGS